MSGFLGIWQIDDLLSWTVVTQVFATGVATDADAAPAYRVYEDETTAPILTGNMALLDSANTAGLYSEQITLSAANGFEVGKCYNIHIAATVSSVAGATTRNFQVEAAPATAAALAVVDGIVDDILLDTAEIGAAGAGLTNINLPNQTMDITGNITGNLSGSVGSVTGAVGSVTGAVGSVTGAVGSVTGAVGSVTGLTASNLDATISSRATPAQVNSEVVDALATDTYAQPGQEAPAATTSIALMLRYLYKQFRNKKTQSSTEFKLYADDTTTVDQKSTVSDDGTTATRGEVGTGA